MPDTFIGGASKASRSSLIASLLACYPLHFRLELPIVMAQIIVRNLDDDVRDRLRDRAQSHGRSMEEEVRDILRAAVAAGGGEPRQLGSWCREQFAGNPDLGDEPFNPEEFRGGVPRPPSFDG